MTPEQFDAQLDQAQAMVRDMRADKGAARDEHRCVAPPTGCGQPLGRSLATAFRDQASRDEYDITGMCQSCQDEMFKPSRDELLAMAADKRNYDRCGCCGEWRELIHVDVGVGVISGFDCCREEDYRALPRCPVAPCGLRADHAHWHDFEEG